MDDDGIPLIEEGSVDRFMIARNGDNLITSFQCELCHFRNIKGRNPDGGNREDNAMMNYMRRANLDAFWSRETRTIRTNYLELKRGEEAMKRKFRLESATGPMGPFPLEDVLGMKAALVLLDRTLDVGRYEPRVQHNTFRKAGTAQANCYLASAAGVGDAIGVSEKKVAAWISGGPTHTRWYGRFMIGVKKRVGEVVKQDEPITIEVMKAVQELLEKRWEAATTPEEKEAVATMAVWFLVGFCVGLRGEEMLLIEFNATANSLRYLTARESIPYFLLGISGRIKTNQGQNSHIWLPCAGETSKSKLKPGMWMTRLVGLKRDRGIKDGYLFSKRNGRKGTLSDFADEFYEVLEAVQALEHNPPIEADVNVNEAYGIWRSLRRGVTAHAVNVGTPLNLIHQINRWRGELNNSGMSGRDILAVYAALKAIIPTLIKYSWGH